MGRRPPDSIAVNFSLSYDIFHQFSTFHIMEMFKIVISSRLRSNVNTNQLMVTTHLQRLSPISSEHSKGFHTKDWKS